MRWSRYYLYTTREVPNDAEVVSHQLMIRTGMVKKVAAGIYSTLPIGWRVLSKLMAIVRRELDRAGAIELAMPAVQPAELWIESGRWERYGKELLRIEDRHGRGFCFGPTHEEVITDIVRRDLRSYRQLPVNLYQIQAKFRDEIRPRFGLMRGREFLMKDAYSFHVDAASLDEAYQAMHAAYCRVFEACGLEYTAVDADTGTIGGSASHEFMVLAETGESSIVHCPSCGYAANVEKAEIQPLIAPPAGDETGLREVPTPGARSVAEVAAFLDVSPQLVVKTLIYETEKGFVAVAIRGDREVNETKLANQLDVQHLELASDEKVEQVTGAPVGFAGPVGRSGGLRLVADESVRELSGFVCGANRDEAHFVGVCWGRDAEVDLWGDLSLAVAGDGCPRCSTPLAGSRGIEVGHIFKLGDKYSAAMGCTFDDEEGNSRPMIMGCYGLGIGRTVAAAIEQNHDENGVIWPLPLAPFAVALLALNSDDPAVRSAADGIYEGLTTAGVEVLYDDRDERPGVKFKDADLLGLPLRVVVGARSLEQGTVELSARRQGERQAVPLGEAVERVRLRLTELAAG